MPLRVLGDRNRGASFLSIAISGAAIYGVLLFLTYYLQDLRGFSPIATGLAFLPMSATIMGAAILGQTKLQARFGQRPLVVTGMTLGSAGMLYLTQIGVSSSYAGDILPALLVTGVGLGLVISTSISNATLGVEPNDAGVASATVSASQQIGASLGTSLLSTVAASAVAHYLAGSPRPQPPRPQPDRPRHRPRIHRRVLMGRRDLRRRRDRERDAVQGPRPERRTVS